MADEMSDIQETPPPPPPPDNEEGNSSSDGVTVPEELQQATGALLKKATTRAHIDHIRGRVSQRDDELREEARKKAQPKGKKGAKGPEEYSLAHGPLNY